MDFESDRSGDMLTDERLRELQEEDERQYYGLDRDEVRELINGSDELLDQIRTLQQQNKQLIDHMGWASRIIDSVMYSPNPPCYDPDYWFEKYHELLKGGTSNGTS